VVGSVPGGNGWALPRFGSAADFAELGGSAPVRAGAGDATPEPEPPPDEVPPIGPGEAGGRKGISIVSVPPSASSLDPAVIAASVGMEARPTSNATMSTYRRVGPEKPESAR
jgi:hypothetical protein